MTDRDRISLHELPTIGLNKKLHTLDGVYLFASSRRDEVNEIFAKMDATIKRRESREKRAKELNPNPIIKVLNVNGSSEAKVEISYKDHVYNFKDESGLVEFMREYLPKAPECVTCDRVLFPGDGVAECDRGLMHMAMDCCPAAVMFVGHIDCNGGVVGYLNKSQQEVPSQEEKIAKLGNLQGLVGVVCKEIVEENGQIKTITLE